MKRITVDVLDTDGATLHTSIPAGRIRYGEETSAAAACRLELPVEHPAAADLVPGNLLRFKADGVTDGTAVIVKADEAKLRPRGTGRLVEVEGLDWVALLSDAPVTPSAGIEALPAAKEVRFDWTHPAIDTSGWATPVATGAVWGATVDALDNPAPATVPGKWNAPAGHTDANGQWIWDRVLTGPTYSHPVGTCIFHHQQTLGGTDNAVAALVWTADDRGALAVNGVVVDPGVDAPSSQWTTARLAAVELEPGVHTFRIRATNDAWLGAGGSYNSGGVTLTAYLLPNAQARFTQANLWFRTSTTPSDWKVLAYPTSEPAFTVPHAVRLLVQRAQADGHIPGVTCGFTDTTWSDGSTASVVPDLVARTSDDLFDTLTAWQSLGHLDFAFDRTTRVLRVWPWQGRPRSSYTLTADQLASVVVQRRR